MMGEGTFYQRSASFEWCGMPVPRLMVLVGCRTTDAVGHDDSKRSRWCFRYVVLLSLACSLCLLTSQIFLGLNLYPTTHLLSLKTNPLAQFRENKQNVSSTHSFTISTMRQSLQRTSTLMITFSIWYSETTTHTNPKSCRIITVTSVFHPFLNFHTKQIDKNFTNSC